jgi:NifU-like protein involved in Fe-S cluster formation
MTTGRGMYANPEDGDVIELDVDLRGDSVAVTRMDLRCCDAATRAAKELSRWAYGKTPEDAARIESRELIARLGLLAGEERCALTAIAALRAALVDAHVKELA